MARNVKAWFLGDLSAHGDPAGVTYGTLIAGAIIAIELGHAYDLPKSIAIIVCAAVLYWAADAYANNVGYRYLHREPFSWSSVGRSLWFERSVARGATLPIVAIIVAGAAQRSVIRSLEVGEWMAIVQLIAYEVIVGVRIGARGLQLAYQAIAGAVLGAGILFLKSIVG